MKLPLGPTLVALVTVPGLVALGFWQLERRDEKAAGLAAFARPRSAVVRCDALEGPVRQVAGRNLAGRVGYTHRAWCTTGTTRTAINLGWTPRPFTVALPGGPQRIEATLFRLPDKGPLMLSRAPAPPLLASAPPSSAAISNNHLSYALQWFSFALILTIVYALYARRWRRDRASPTGA